MNQYDQARITCGPSMGRVVELIERASGRTAIGPTNAVFIGPDDEDHWFVQAVDKRLLDVACTDGHIEQREVACMGESEMETIKTKSRRWYC